VPYEFGSLHDFILDHPPPRVIDTIGYRRSFPEPGVAEIVWEDPLPYTFPHHDGSQLVHGGMLAALADTAMGHACFSLLDFGQNFLTADLRVDFLRAVPSQPIISIGRVDRRTRRIYYCSSEIRNLAGDVLFAIGRCNQVVLDVSSSEG
jgi:uncharacterized protein (TIGR00369 family)